MARGFATREFGRSSRFAWLLVGLLELIRLATCDASDVSLDWSDNYLTVTSPSKLPRGPLRIHYLEAYCRANSQTTDWVEHTVIGHTTRKLSASADGSRLELQCRLNDGLIVNHWLSADADGVRIRVEATNPTSHRSEAHWAQPCVRVGRFTGLDAEATDDAYAYLRKSFIFVDGQLRRMPFEPWAMRARYEPGQVWAAPGVPRSDVNPRPLSDVVPSNGLIGCFSDDEQRILAIAFEPYQELFQGVIRCLHSDFRLGGLDPGESRTIHGRIYLVPNDLEALLDKYRRDFPDRR